MKIKEIITKFGLHTIILLILSVLILAQITFAENSFKVVESKNTSIDGVFIESVKMTDAYLDTPIINPDKQDNNFSRLSINSATSFSLTIEQNQNIDNRIKEKKAKIDSNLIRFKSGYNLFVNSTVGNAISSQSVSSTTLKTAPEYYLIQFNDSFNSVDVETRNELQNSGVVLINYVPNNAFYAKIPAAALDNISYLIANEKIKYLGRIPSQAKISQQFLLEVQKNPDDFTNVVVHLFEEPTEAELKILYNYMEIDSYSNITYFVYGRASANNITNIYSLEFVKYIEKSLPARTFNNDATSGVANDIVQYTGYTGLGVRVAVADSGIAQQGSIFHPDLPDSRIADQHDFKYLALDDDIADDECGHGTHVAGTIGGSGSKSGGKNRGMAPDVTFLIYRFTNESGSVEAGQFDNLAKRSAVNHADIISNSWGGGNGIYDSNSEIADKLVRGDFTDSTVSNLLGNPQHMNVVIAAGNDNDYTSSPGTAKNAITVGAAKDGNFAPITLSWPACSDNNWPQGQTVCFSNYGPIDIDNDGYTRVKPDVIAPGVIINSTTPWYPYNLYDPSNLRGYYYGIMSGTSMATPVVSGAIATLLEAYPSVKGWPEMVKARVINTAISAENPQVREGRGLIDSYHMIYSDTTFINLKWIGDSVDTSDQLKTYYFEVPNNFKEVKVTLTWSDPAGSSEVTNDLDLDIFDSDGALINFAISYDDTVEQATATAGTPGQWRAVVSATTLNDGPQRFGLSASAILVEPSLNLIASADKTSIGPDEMLKVTTDISNIGYTALGSYISIEVPNGMLVDSADIYRADGVIFNYPLSEIYHVPYIGGERYYLAVGELINDYSRKVDWNIRSNSNIADGSYTINIDGAARNTVSSPSANIVVNVGTTTDTKTTTGTVSETHTCDSISITATYSGDTDNDGLATLFYKQSSSSSWICYGTMTKSSSQYTKTITGLAENTNYDVYVDYSDSDGVIGTNPIYQYSINTGSCANSPPSTPILDDPGTTDADGSYRVTWSYHPDATYFNLEEDSSSSFLSPTSYAPSVNAKSFTGKGNGAYYYRVQACNINGCSGWSNTESITVSLGTISDNSYAGNMFGSVFTGDTTTVKDYSNGVYKVRVTGRYYATSPRQLSVEIYKSGSLIDTSLISEQTIYYFDNYNLQVFVTSTIYGPPMYGEAIAINTKTTSAEVDAVPSTITIAQGSTGSIYFDIPTSTDGAYNDFFVGGTARDWVTDPPIQTYGTSTNELSYISSSPTDIDITVPSSTSSGTYTLFLLATTGTFIENDVGSAVYSVKQVQINVEQANNPPIIPNNPTPQNGAINQPINPTLSWTGGDPDSGDLVTYDVYLDSSPNPTTKRYSSITSTSCSISGLNYEQQYYWQVVAKDNKDTYTAGPIWSFSTGPQPNNPPNIPSNPFPINGANNQPLNPVISWSGGDTDAGDLVTYDVYLDTNPNPITQVCSTTLTSCSVSGLEHDTTYYWKVVASDGELSTTSPVWSFITKPLTVCSSGCGYTSIQAAIDAAKIGDTIEVYSGTYYENVNVNKQLNLQGFDTGNGAPVVDGSGVMYTISLNADGISLTNFNITNSRWDGIIVYSNYNTLVGNRVYSNSRNGIVLFYSSNNILIENNVSNNIEGIMLYYSNNNTLTGNNISNNERGIILKYSNNSILNDNTALYNTYEGIQLTFFSRNNTLMYNNFSSNSWDGIDLISSNDNNITENNVLNNRLYGISITGAVSTETGEIFQSSNNNVNGNNLLNNNVGIRVVVASNNTINNNNIRSNNEYGISLESSSDNNIIFHNHLINIKNAYDTCSNSWDFGSQGNYYSDYNGIDSNGDGIGDTPYLIPGGSNIDYYPLMQPSPDNIPPAIISSYPVDGSVNVPLTQRTVLFTFNEPMQPNVSVIWWGLNDDYINNASLDWSLDQKTITYTFDRDFPADTIIEWLLNPSTYESGFKDLAGNPLPADTYFGSFNTSSSVSDNIPPVLISTNPADGSTNIPVTQRTVSFTFNESMQSSISVTWWNLNEEYVNNATTEWSLDQKTVYFTFDRDLPANTMVAWDLNPSTHGLGFKDLSGNPLPADMYSGSFNTNSSVSDNIPPVFLFSNPADGVANIPVTQRIISFTFNEAMQPSVSITWWGVSEEMVSNITSIEWSPDQKTVSFTFDRDLPPNTMVRWDLNPSTHEPGFKDLAGNPLPANTYSGSFNTSSSVSDNIPPVLISSNPADGSTNIPVTQRTASFTFNESMQPDVSVTWWNLNEDYVNNATTEWSLDQKTVSFTFDRDLPANTMVAWDLNPSTHGLGFKDLAGNPLPADMYSGSFNTSSSVSDNLPPVLVSSNPISGSAHIPITQRTVSFTFNESMQPDVSVTWWGLNDNYSNNASIDWSPDQKTISFSFDRDLSINTTISWVLNPSTHQPGFKDLAGNPLPADTYFGSFSTATVVEDQLIDTQNGIARLSTPEGFVDEASTVDKSSLPPNPEIEFPFGVFSFNISNLNIGQTINISIELPQELTPDAKYWKFSRTISDPTPHWYEIPMEISSDNRSIKIQLTDGGLGDDDLIENGEIVDPGAPGISRKGDFSGDGTTDAWDITYLARSITGIPGYEVLSSGDVSGDGVVDAWDCTYLARAIAGVPGYSV